MGPRTRRWRSGPNQRLRTHGGLVYPENARAPTQQRRTFTFSQVNVYCSTPGLIIPGDGDRSEATKTDDDRDVQQPPQHTTAYYHWPEVLTHCDIRDIALHDLHAFAGVHVLLKAPTKDQH